MNLKIELPNDGPLAGFVRGKKYNGKDVFYEPSDSERRQSAITAKVIESFQQVINYRTTHGITFPDILSPLTSTVMIPGTYDYFEVVRYQNCQLTIVVLKNLLLGYDDIVGWWHKHLTGHDEIINDDGGNEIVSALNNVLVAHKEEQENHAKSLGGAA